MASDSEDEPEMQERYRHLSTIRELVDYLLVREMRGNWFFAHAGGLADMQFVLDDILGQIKSQVSEQAAVTRSKTTWGPDGKKRGLKK